MAVQSAPARAKARQAKTEVESERPVARQPVRQQADSGYFDRDGNPLVRKNPSFRNQFDFSPSEVPEGYEYQWIRHTVHGDPSDSELFDMQENGWRTVPHERHKARFAATTVEGKGCILRQGQLLVERPKGMCDDARAQQKREADAAIGQQFQRFSVPLPDNVQRMGLAGRGAVARQTDDIQTVRADFKPKHELEIE